MKLLKEINLIYPILIGVITVTTFVVGTLTALKFDSEYTRKTLDKVVNLLEDKSKDIAQLQIDVARIKDKEGIDR